MNKVIHEMGTQGTIYHQTGDIALWTAINAFGAPVRYYTGQPVGHAGVIIVKEDGSVHVIHAKYGWYLRGSVVEEPLSGAMKGIHSIVRVSASIFPNTTAYDIAIQAVGQRAIESVGQGYDYFAVLGILLDPIGLGNLIPDSKSRTVCSELCSRVWEPSGLLPWSLVGRSLFIDKAHSHVTPGDILQSRYVEEVWNNEAWKN